MKLVYRRKTIQFQLTILTDAGNQLSLNAGDVIIIRVGWVRGRRVLRFSSDAPTANGSTVQFANPSLVELKADDLDIAAGVYDIEVSVLDTSGDCRGAQTETLIVRALLEDSSSSTSSSSTSSLSSSSTSSLSSSSVSSSSESSSVSSSSVSSSSVSSSSSSSVSSSSVSSSSVSSSSTECSTSSMS